MKSQNELSQNPWALFYALAQGKNEGVFLESWGPEGEHVFAFEPEHHLSGQCLKGASHFENAWKSIELWAQQHQAYVLALIGYGVGLELDRVRGMESSGSLQDFRLLGFKRIYTWSSAQGLRLNGISVELPDHCPMGPWKVVDFAPVVQAQEYGQWVNQTKEYILAGDIFQANLAHPLQVSFEGDPFALYGEIRAYNPSPYAGFWFNRSEEQYLLSNSPELLFEIKGAKITTKPIAGTRKRGRDDSHDDQLMAELFGNEKEQAEHLMLVDLERNDLGRICRIGTVEVEEFMGCEQYRNVTHIVSTVTGHAREGLSSWEALKALFPGGTITGAPKLRSMEIIHELERFPRGFYTGSLGWLSPSGEMCFNILIRSMQLQSGMGQIHVGAGIVADSIPEREYQETLHKGAAWKKVLAYDCD